MARYRRRRRHLRADEVIRPALPLAALGAVDVDAQRSPGYRMSGSSRHIEHPRHASRIRFREYAVQAFFLGLPFHCMLPGTTIAYT
jgi:hypothetical protein